MHKRNPIIGTEGWAAAIWLAAIIVFSAALPSGAFAAQQAEGQAAPSTSAEATPTKIHELLALLADRGVQEWLEKQGREAKNAAGSSQETANGSVSHYFNVRIGAIREHIVTLAATLPDLPNQFRRGAARVSMDLGNRGRLKILLHLALFVGLGFGLEGLFRQATGKMRRHLDTLPMETVQQRLRVIAERFGVAVGFVVAFALGSIGPFLVFDWAPLFREMLLGYLLAFLVTRVAYIFSRLLLAPDHELFRIIPMNPAAARFWCRRITAFVGWFAFGWVLVGLVGTLGYSLEGRQIVAYAFGLVLLAVALEAVWRRPVAPNESAATPSPAPHHLHHLGRGARNTLLSVGIVLLWVLWVLRAMPSFWLLLVIIALPLAINATGRAIEHLLRPSAVGGTAAGPPGHISVCFRRGMRALLIIGAVAVVAWGFGMNMVHLVGQDTLLARVAHGVLSAVVILLVADVVWHTTKAAIDRKLADAAVLGQANTDEARRRARLRTLLPIFRNILFVVVITVALLMALAAMGVQIGPLIAGAGVVGVAVGFGAQTFVRDVIAGMFYLIDDAFRIGE
ncbi:MAG: mechanosensitive ion channel family protein, partial [Alphaproteobacteria bacterium]|nr:mechanosensitive ion channel family protein [Alphaproteobacteria bacterium]